jgi:hypothetical protein
MGCEPTRERRGTALTWGRGTHILAIRRAGATNEKDDRDTFEPDGARALELSGRAAQRNVAADVIISLNLKRRQAMLRDIWRTMAAYARRRDVGNVRNRAPSCSRDLHLHRGCAGSSLIS